MEPIRMVDLQRQYAHIKDRVDAAVIRCMDEANFINGPEVKKFAINLQNYLSVKKVITCANGTDALQIAFMALDLEPGSEVIVPSFTYVATAEVICLLGLTPVMVDVDPHTFNLTADLIEQAITEKTRAVVPVHLFGQCVDMDAIMALARKHNIYVIEDTAQAIGAEYSGCEYNGKAGTIGDIGCTSFFPSKNLGCFGDGGAVYTNNEELAAKLSMIANHGQERKYVHKYIGINSRLDTLQAAILDIKLEHLDEYCEKRRHAADFYDNAFRNVPGLVIPARNPRSTHVFHQYTLKVPAERRQALQDYLQDKGIPSMIYYPLPLNEQEAFKGKSRIAGELNVTKELCESVLSLPMHTELSQEQLEHIQQSVIEFFQGN
ncbi:DegT/DnrJ/EryC1/StrS family aminotransferase [Chitinophaga horti]|uniref:DegT/DnrJ/EryC1/StrS family aminotransferase n=1 Tax=Chitinophaga horti TaxID=2920382 RepID=A0ABY6IYH6_9BACT|nr:DegT/DnrJ/EryC1/StrS family aminotransferase [Chitinophaga horti]UYQ92435.1 DegT/DnrJ/EryC1/StrS family aminotransferase [Chitinophaga horti]